MEKYIDMTVSQMLKTEIKNILKESGLKKRLLKGDFSDGIISVNVKEILPFVRTWSTYSLGISAENIESAAKIYNSILEKSEKIGCVLNSTLCTDKPYSGTGTEIGGMIKG